MAAPSFFEMFKGAAADLANAAVGAVRVFVDIATGEPSFKDESGTVVSLKGATGATGPAGPAYVPTVTAHGSMGATETFDYDGGDAPSHSGTVNAALTITLTGWAATGNESVMSLYFTTDGTGGYGTPTWPAAVVNDADYTTWDDAAGALNVIRLWTIDGGTTVYIAIDEAGAASDLDAIIAASSGQDIADALAGAAAPDASNVFATMADVGGGGGGSTELGYAQITGDVTTTSQTLVDATGLSVTVTAPSGAIIVEAWAGEIRTDGSIGGDTRVIAQLYDTTGAAAIAQSLTACFTGSGSAMILRARVTPGAGSRSYKVRFNTVQPGTAVIRATATSPAFIRVTTA